MEIKRVLITGGAGMLGSAFTELLKEKGHTVRSLDHHSLDITHRENVLAEAEFKPEWIIHCAGIVNAEYCEENREDCFRVHVEGTKHVIELAERTEAKLFFPQSFLIFDGDANPIVEETLPYPLSVYGEAKLQAEEEIKKALPDALIVRMGGFFGGEEKDKNFVGIFTRILKKKLEAGEKTALGGVRVWQPTWTKELAANTLLLLESEKTGIYHMASHGEASFYDIAVLIVETLGLAGKITIEPAPPYAFKEKGKRPERAVMENKRLKEEGLDRMREWEESLREYLKRPYFQEMFKE